MKNIYNNKDNQLMNYLINGWCISEDELDLKGRFNQFYQEDQDIIPNSILSLINRDYIKLSQKMNLSHRLSDKYLWNIVEPIHYLQNKALELGSYSIFRIGAVLEEVYIRLL